MPEAPVRARQMVLVIELGSVAAGSASSLAAISPLMMPKTSAAAAKTGVSRNTPLCGISHTRASSNCPPMWAKAARMLQADRAEPARRQMTGEAEHRAG